MLFNNEKNLRKIYAKAGKKFLNFSSSCLCSGAKLTGKAVKKTVIYTYNHRKQIAGAAAGLTKGAVETGKGIYGYTISENDLKNQINILTAQSEEFARLNKIYCSKLLNRKSQKEILLDSLFSSTVFLSKYYNTDTIPADVEMAYTLAYPDLSATTSLSSVIENADPEQAAGYINAIKGKLFELRYIEYLNNGNLPEGYTAKLAESATNPGWDLQITDKFGGTADILQLKATESVAYVNDALIKYPNIDIVTTEEVYNQLALNGMADHVINSGISNDELTSVVTQSLDSADFKMDWVPSVIPFLIIGYSVSKKSRLTAYQKGKEFGARSFSSWIAYITGGAVTGLTGFWIGGLGAVLLTNYALENGRLRLKHYYDLKRSISYNNNILNRLKYKISVL